MHIWNSVLDIVFEPDLSMVKNHFKILVVGSGSGSSQKSNQFVVVTPPTYPPSFFQIRPQLFEISCCILVYHYLSMVKNHLNEIIRSRSGLGSSPKLNHFFLVTHPLCPPTFIRICPQLFEILCHILVSPYLSMVKNHLKKSSDPDLESELHQN